MKTFTKISIAVLIPLLYCFLFTGFNSGTRYSPPPPPGGDGFINMIFNNGVDTVYPEAWIDHWFYHYKDSLHFNAIHSYDWINGGENKNINGTYRYGYFDQDLTEGQIYNTKVLQDEAIGTHSLAYFMERAKISKLCYAQRLVYEVKNPTSNEKVNNGFCYQNTSGCYETDSGRTVLHESPNPIIQCNEWDAAPGYLAQNIYENLQHSDLYDFNLQYADSGTWYMKPMMRIDSSIVDNYPERPVIRIVATNFQGDTIKNIVIKAKHFARDLNGSIYSGQYVDVYNYIQDPQFNLEVSGSDTLSNGLGKGSTGYGWWDWDEQCKIDFKVYWFGEVEVWFDKMTVDDFWGNRLFSGIDDPKINDEISAYTSNHWNIVYFADEITYSQVPCVKYVKQKLDAYGIKLMTATTNYLNVHGMKNDTLAHRYYMTELQPEMFSNDAHELPWELPNSFVQTPPFDGAVLVSPAVYNEKLQEKLGDKNTRLYDFGPGTLVYQIELARNQSITYGNNTKFIMQPQLHGFFTSDGVNLLGLREPLDEEIQAQAMLSIAHGADGICWFIFNSFGVVPPPNPHPHRDLPIGDNYEFVAQLGLRDISLQPRHSNLYGQDKWKDVADMNIKIEKWIPTLNNITWQAGYSVHSEGANHEYIDGILSVDPRLSYQNPCTTDAPPETWADCPDETYWEMGFFQLTEDNVKYFMMVNRRCVPIHGDNEGDIRALRINFDANELPGPNNWTIYNVANLSEFVTFDKTVYGYVDLYNDGNPLGYFEPGEGKLFCLVPTTKRGGTLVADELIPSGSDFTCEDTVWTNGHNLTIEDGVTIHFSDSAKFVVHGGTFQMGIAQHSGSNTINIDAEQGNSWQGFEFDTCNVKIYGVNFSGLANDSIAMLTMIDCPVIDLRSNSFTLGSNNNVWAVDINYSGSYGSSLNDNVYIANNSFPNSSSVLPYVKVMAYSGITTPVIVEGNNFTGTSTALFLNNIQGGAIKSNSFTGFGTAITALSSSLDVFENTVSSSGTYGIQALEGTELKMSYAGGLLVGGRNNITNSGTNSYNLYLENSYFLMDEGENIFDIGTSSYHLNGWFPDSYSGSYEETENCFKVQGSVVDPPEHYVTLGEQGNQITDFEFTPYLTGCTQGGEGDMMVINLGNGIYDTIGIMGEGGSYSSNYIVTPKSIYDSISVSMRFRNYSNVKTLCLQLLNSYPDSVQSLGAISKLYLAVSKTDTTTLGITDLKTLYENLILNHSTNISLVKRCNYYVQKCKVLLHQYSSALSGFQQIINQNPASYEGLIARWDYMATSLLMQGQGGGDYGVFQPGWNSVNTVDAVQKEDDDRSPFTREEKKQIKQAVTTALEISKSTENKRREVLTELSSRGDVKQTKQLNVLKSLEQTVKVERPKNIVEHMKIVAGDIQKVFVNPNAGKNANTTFIPQVFRLSQNYPNPFNPTTKINYDIPQNSIVKLTIYDILGREVIKLVNNEFKQPGRYVVEFNGTNLASGVYFYRIEANDFVDSKKMVLIK